MVKRWLGVLCMFGVLLGLTGCASRQVDLAGEWVYENPAGEGIARISIEHGGAFKITGWPSNLKMGMKDGLNAADKEVLDWDGPLSFSGQLDKTKAERYGTAVYFSSHEETPWLNFDGYLASTCEYVLFICIPTGDEMNVYLDDLNDEYNYVSFIRSDDSPEL